MELEPWDQDAIETRLDRLGVGYIEFNEFSKFTKDYGVDWGEPLLEIDELQIAETKNNVSYKDYTVTEADYFKENPTMLTNEKAAMAKALEIFKRLEETGEKYIDETFGPKNLDDKKGKMYSLYKEGVPEQKTSKYPDEILWDFPGWLAHDEEAVFSNDGGVTPIDCMQGNLGNSWFISALSALANKE